MTNRAMVYDGIGPVLGYLVANAAHNALQGMEEGRETVENYAKSNAPWADRTGDARNGLTASVYEDAGEIVLELAHSVDYGLWLELIQDGKFAIIMPTLEAVGAKVLRDAGGRVVEVGIL